MFSKSTVALRKGMVDYKDSWDLAVLELDDSCSDASHFLALPAIGAGDIHQDNEEDKNWTN